MYDLMSYTLFYINYLVQLYLTSHLIKSALKRINLVITCVSLPLITEQCLYKNTIKSVFVPIIVLHVMPPSWPPSYPYHRTTEQSADG